MVDFNKIGQGVAAQAVGRATYKDPLTDNSYWGGADKTPWAGPKANSTMGNVFDLTGVGMAAANQGIANQFNGSMQSHSADNRAPGMNALNKRYEMLGQANYKNPFTADNPGLMQMKGNIVGQNAGAFGDALTHQREGLATRGLTPGSGISQFTEGQSRLGLAKANSQQMAGLDAANYDKAASWDSANRQFQLQLQNALSNNDVQAFDRAYKSFTDTQERLRQSPFDALKLQQGQQDYQYNAQNNPLKIAAAQQALQSGNVQLAAALMQNDTYRQTQGGVINATNSQNGLTAANNNYTLADVERIRNNPALMAMYNMGQDANIAKGWLTSMDGAGQAAYAPAQRVMSQAQDTVKGVLGLPGLGGGAGSVSQNGTFTGKNGVYGPF